MLKAFLLKEKVQYQQDDDHKDCQEPVLNHPQVQEGDEPPGFNRSPAQSVYAPVNYLIIIFGTQVGYPAVDDDIQKLPVKTVDVPTLGKQGIQRHNFFNKPHLLRPAATEFQPGQNHP